MEPLLDVRGLSVRYRPTAGGAIFALDSATFQTDSGEVLGVLGESGSGKSTLAASVLGMLAPNAVVGAGTVLLGAQNLLALSPVEMSRIRGNRISLIFQEPGVALHPTMRVGDQVEEVLRAHSSEGAQKRRERARSVFSLVFDRDADRIYRSYPHQLSGGQRQRVVIAQAIASRPALLLADEPTASLDPVTQCEILDLFRRLKRELNLAILFITHYPDLLGGFADRVIVLYAGQVIEEGGARDVLVSPQHPYTKALLESRPGLNQRAESAPGSKLPVIPGEAPTLSTLSVGCVFEPRCPDRMEMCRDRKPGPIVIGTLRQVSCFKYGG